ncbi:probable LRR receptor-like serine/threonine-protein kinase PAM74 [Selaginella moellendorffii]|uniref:probable LRR receptor-like serine/threonine-protein kinase PAM74 n=1 Tax=Selaginella moellendorffii TaxID=88036 RepID=UPI000D1CE78B|nr:probable LRR receptor-like serine/threonine-protein kinase PAM74 [Selaginella moellendorffii]|eukprot:XP_024537067.1 probable LRR receptor-like serine/threonine-protein kinase PAM74 [Selaginella moellendorffii]
MWSADHLLLPFTLGFILAAQTYVSAQPGFLSLDCGAFDSHTDVNGIEWIPDDKYITTGETASISSLLKKDADLIVQRLRYFNDTSRKHCYALPVVVDESYIVRPRFYYGNYDGLESTRVEFDIAIGANTVMNASLGSQSSWYYEFVVKATNSTLDLCLGTSSNSPANIPFISTIELRRLAPGMSGSVLDYSEVLLMWRRINLGATSNEDIRYPLDEYDRIWRADKSFKNMGSYQRINTNSTVSVGKTFNKPPTAVMSSAIVSNSVMVFEFPATLEATKYYVNFYFAEFFALGNDTREFTLLFNTSSLETPQIAVTVNIEKHTQAPLTSVQVYLKAPVELSNPTRFFLVPTPNSTLGAVLNAAELFEYKGGLLPGTEPNDVVAIRDVMNDFNITGWSGDPCLPLPYTWQWITCDVAQIPARITELNLSNQRLSGNISQSITKLLHLTKIYLDNNALTGPVPNFSSLKNLTVLSLQNNSLDCVPPELQLSFNTSVKLCEKLDAKKTKNTTLLIGIAVPCVAMLLLAAGLVVCFMSRRKTDKSPGTIRPQESDTKDTESPSLAPKSPNSSTKNFSYKDVIEATNNFKQVLGEGSFGPVYYGRLSNGVEVAVKVLSSSSKQGYQEFNTEIDILSVVHHRNLVSFLGYCDHGSKLILLYEFLSNGTLREHLYGTSCPTLSWKSRLQIALDAAQGLEYLHTSCNLHIIHRDIKTTNILLSSAMVAKVSDFGLSKLYDKNNASHVSTIVKGTPGYLDPEYHSYSRLTEKSDVYSFGVVLFEIVCSREPINLTLPEEQVVLSKWACRELERGNLKTLIDPKLSSYKEQAVWKVLELAMNCVEHRSDRRPNMSAVVNELKEAIQLEEEGNSITRPMDTFSRGR